MAKMGQSISKWITPDRVGTCCDLEKRSRMAVDTENPRTLYRLQGTGVTGASVASRPLKQPF